jgi:hypothetical protein
MVPRWCFGGFEVGISKDDFLARLRLEASLGYHHHRKLTFDCEVRLHS